MREVFEFYNLSATFFLKNKHFHDFLYKKRGKNTFLAVLKYKRQKESLSLRPIYLLKK